MLPNNAVQLRKPKTPPITWNNTKWAFEITLTEFELTETLPYAFDLYSTCVWIVQLRKKGTEQWSIGFKTPLDWCEITYLEPDTTYEIKQTPLYKDGTKGEPVYKTLHYEG